MLFVQPEWRLARVDCPCCRSSALTFCACPSCALVVLVCDGSQTVFGSPRAVAEGRAVEPVAGPFEAAEVDCPACGSVPLLEFRFATSAEVRGLGFEPGEYA